MTDNISNFNANLQDNEFNNSILQNINEDVDKINNASNFTSINESTVNKYLTTPKRDIFFKSSKVNELENIHSLKKFSQNNLPLNENTDNSIQNLAEKQSRPLQRFRSLQCSLGFFLILSFYIFFRSI